MMDMKRTSHLVPLLFFRGLMGLLWPNVYRRTATVSGLYLMRYEKDPCNRDTA